MKKIIWQSRSDVVYKSFQQKQLVIAANGGNAYDYHAASVLSTLFELHMDPVAVQLPKETSISYWLRLLKHRPQADVLIMEPMPMLFGSLSTNIKRVVVLHHLDENKHRLSIKRKLFNYFFLKKIKNADLVITVSKYWENYLLKSGCANVKVIYNAFNPSSYSVTDDAVSQFKLRHKFNDEQPIIYIGNASRKKGVYRVYEVLKNQPYQLVMSGKQNDATDLPVRFLKLDRIEYITLLKAADMVITLSNLTEGWNRVAHEALLCRTPVIGSGTGGMKELLEGAGQKIITNNDEIIPAIKNALQHKSSLGDSGYEFVSQFDIPYFENEWQQAIQQLLKKTD